MTPPPRASRTPRPLEAGRARPPLLALVAATALFAAAAGLVSAQSPLEVDLRSVAYDPAARQLLVEYAAAGPALPPRVEVDGRDVAIPDAARTVGASTGTVVLAIEASSSTAGERLQQELQFARTLLDALPPEVAVGVVYFGDAVREAERPGTNRAITSAALAAPPIGSGAALYDGVASAADLLAGSPGPRSLVVLTFGWHFGAQDVTRDDSAAAVVASGATVHAVAVGSDYDAGYLRGLAGAAGSFTAGADPAVAQAIARGAASSTHRLQLPLELAPGSHALRVSIGGATAERALEVAGAVSAAPPAAPSASAPATSATTAATTAAPAAPARTPLSAGRSAALLLGALALAAAAFGASSRLLPFVASRRTAAGTTDHDTTLDDASGSTEAELEAPLSIQSLLERVAASSGTPGAWAPSAPPDPASPDVPGDTASSPAEIASPPVNTPAAMVPVAMLPVVARSEAPASPEASEAPPAPAAEALPEAFPDLSTTMPAASADASATAEAASDLPPDVLPGAPSIWDRGRAWLNAVLPGGANATPATPLRPRPGPGATTVEARIRHALQRNTLAVHYQPLFRAATGELVGAEALLRPDGDQGEVPSTRTVLREAMAMGRIAEITALVIPAACRVARAFATAEGAPAAVTPISVNLTAEQLLDREFMRVLTGALLEFSVPSGQLAIEVPEFSLIGNAAAAAVLHDVSRLGVLVIVDDFWASTTELPKQLPPLYAVKVDVSHGSGSPRAEQELRRVVASAREAGIPVIAKRVESLEERAFAGSLGCAVMQGIQFSPPLPGTDLVEVAGKIARRLAPATTQTPDENGDTPTRLVA